MTNNIEVQVSIKIVYNQPKREISRKMTKINKTEEIIKKSKIILNRKIKQRQTIT